jgi:hypothetical protein
MKGFKDGKGKFHPTGKHSPLKKSDIQIRKDDSLGSGDAGELKDKNQKNSIGLTDRKVIYGGYDKDGISDDKRREGNVVIEQIFNMTNETNPEANIEQLDAQSLYNEYSTIQNTLRISGNIIDKLIDWRFDNNPKTWKFVSPLRYWSGKHYVEEENVVDGNNKVFIQEAYKNEDAITLMSPEQFLHYADPVGHGASRTERPVEMKIVNDIADKMKAGKPMDSLSLTIGDDNHVYGHDGQHRALASIIAGIKEVPVIVIKTTGLTEEEQVEITNNPTRILTIR